MANDLKSLGQSCANEATIPGRDALKRIAAEYQPDENCEDAIEVFEPGMEGLKIAIEESRLYIFDPVTDPVRHQSLS